MSILATLLLTSFVALQQVADESTDAALCQSEAISIYLPGDEGTPAPNISLVQFQYRSDDDPCARNISHDELMRLHAAIKPVTAASFAKSKVSFWFMVKYALTPDKPATFEMKASIPQNEQLGLYYEKAAALTGYHSTKGTVEVLFHYEITPAALKSRSHASGNGG